MNKLPSALLLGGLLPLAGCLGNYDVHAPPPASKAATGSQPGAKTAASQPSAPGPTQSSPGSVPPGAAGGPVAQSLPVQLSAGVALPQTLPDGTVMSFSVDYQFLQGQPDSNAAYVWVIERSQGTASRQPVKLKARDTLQGFVADFRPEQAPFQTYLEDARGNRVSATVPLR
jgi:hypothetical protein